MKSIVILGTAREDSHTSAAVQELCPFIDYELIDLRELRIAPYNYIGAYPEDDEFLSVIESMRDADNIVFATPVYWYAMSGILKIFVDRLSDLLTAHKELGRSLKAKKTYLISTGSDPFLPDGFEVPFRLTSKYFEMQYLRAYYKSTK